MPMDDFQIDTSEFLEDFKNEAEDILLQLEEGLLSLERDPLNKDITNSSNIILLLIVSY